MVIVRSVLSGRCSGFSWCAGGALRGVGGMIGEEGGHRGADHTRPPDGGAADAEPFAMSTIAPSPAITPTPAVDLCRATTDDQPPACSRPLVTASRSRPVAGIAINELGAELAARIACRLPSSQRDQWEAVGPYAPGQPLGDGIVHFCIRLDRSARAQDRTADRR
jgi:hypothetical protein